MKSIRKGTCRKFFDLFCTVKESSGNTIDIPLLHIGCSSCVLIKDLFLDVTHRQAGTVRRKLTPHSEPSGLAVLNRYFPLKEKVFKVHPFVHG